MSNHMRQKLIKLQGEIDEVYYSCCSCSVGCNHSSDLIPGPGTPYAMVWPKKKKKSVKDINRYLTKKDTQLKNKYMKK